MAASTTWCQRLSTVKVDKTGMEMGEKELKEKCASHFLLEIKKNYVIERGGNKSAKQC